MTAEQPEFCLGIVLWDGPLINYVAWPVMVATVYWLAYANFKRLHEGNRTLVRNLLVLIGALLSVTAGTAFTYHRVWELAMPLEPDHGPARISHSGTTKLCFVGGADKSFVLLPDGRLWTSPEFLTAETVGFELWTAGRTWTPAGSLTAQMTGAKHWKDRPPSSGRGFLPGSNWVEVAATVGELVAMKDDGSLWSVFRCEHDTAGRLVPVLKLSRIGSDTNWISLAAGQCHFLSVKRDGTLWGWLDNSPSAANPLKSNQVPVKISEQTDWEACFANGGSTGLVVKRDGSVWRWDRLASRGTDGDRQSSGLTGPIRVNLPGKGMKSIAGSNWASGLYEDGSLWVLREMGTVSPYRLGNPGTWLQASFGNGYLAAVRRDGTLWKLYRCWNSKGELLSDQFRTVKASKHSDWVAVSAQYGYLIALAADGKLYEWRGINEHGLDELLRPTRRYLGSVNIFDAPTTLPQAAP